MSAVHGFGRSLNCKYVLCCSLLALGIGLAGPVQAESAGDDRSLPVPSAGSDEGANATGGKPTIEELREHAATINEILDVASERVDRLVAEGDQGSPQLVDAIKQELKLSRQWNDHLGTILLDVAEARRALGEREREAAKEIARMTAMAEEARLELLALKSVLKPGSGKPEQGQGEDVGEQRDSGPRSEIGSQTASSRSLAEAVTGLAGAKGELSDAEASLAFLQEAQRSAAKDVDAVRAKIIEALQTLANARGELPVEPDDDRGDLSSNDITGWAASMATRLARGKLDAVEEPGLDQGDSQP